MKKGKMNDAYKKMYPKSGLDGKTCEIVEMRVEIDGNIYVVSPDHVDIVDGN